MLQVPWQLLTGRVSQPPAAAAHVLEPCRPSARGRGNRRWLSRRRLPARDHCCGSARRAGKATKSFWPAPWLMSPSSMSHAGVSFGRWVCLRVRGNSRAASRHGWSRQGEPPTFDPRRRSQRSQSEILRTADSTCEQGCMLARLAGKCGACGCCVSR